MLWLNLLRKTLFLHNGQFFLSVSVKMLKDNKQTSFRSILLNLMRKTLF